MRSIINALVICCIYLVNISTINAQVCSESGRIAGLDLIGGSGSSFKANHTQILHAYGGVNCYGVVSEWRFFKSDQDCASIFLQIWRPNGQHYILVGSNYYDHAKELCDLAFRGPVIFRIPKDKQIPVQPDDLIGWTSPKYNEMIEYLTGLENGTVIQNITQLCKGDAERPIDPGFNTASCTHAPPNDKISREVYLQAFIETGPAPVFNNLPNVIQIPENSMPGTPSYFPDKLYDVKASLERNTAFNSLEVDLVFSFSEPQMYFDITTEPIDNAEFIPDTQPYTGRVTINQALDYETQQEHIIPIRVDGLGLFDESTLTVQVIDINEPHEISNLPFTTTVNAETAMIGDIVYQVEVLDEDANPDPLTYSIFSTNILDPPPPFKMDSKTGTLLVSEDLYGLVLPQRYILHIAAWDLMYLDNETLVVNLENVRGNPVIQNLNESIEVPEDAPTGSNIFQVVAETRYPVELEYSIAGVIPFQMYNKFVIDQHSGWIRTTDSPDFDYGDDSQWPIYIQANNKSAELTYRDKVENAILKEIQLGRYRIVHERPRIVSPLGAVPKDEDDIRLLHDCSQPVEVCDDVGMDTGFLTIYLTWINRQPLFAPSIYDADIPEKCGEEDNPSSCRPNGVRPWHIPGLELNMYHRDEGVLPDKPLPVDTAWCSIVPGFASSSFGVDNCTYLYVTDAIDVNDKPELMTINLTVLAEDDYGLSDTAVVFLTVYDINDHIPTFTQSSYSATLPENVPGGRSVLTVYATDDDFGENATIVYSLTEIAPYNGTLYFQIHPITGVIYTKGPIDYELLVDETGSNMIQFNVRATDRGIHSNHSERRVYINVQDVNDNRPRFDCVSNKPSWEPVDPTYLCFYNEDTRSDTLVGYTVLVLSAHDPDGFVPRYYLLNPMKHFGLSPFESNKNRGDLHTIDHLLVYYKYMMICMVDDQAQLKARPPVIVRVDTFPPEKHLVDVTLDIPIGDFNNTAIMGDFMTELAVFIHPWYPRLQAQSKEQDRTVATIYALTDNSTFLYENLDKPKYFVHVNELLRELRKNIQGDPTQDFINAIDPAYKPIIVMPAIPNWWIHTIGGLITTFLLLLLLLLLIIVGIILLCRYFAWCCFKKRKHRPTKHAWMKDRRYLHKTDDDMDTIRESDEDNLPPQDYEHECDVHAGDHSPYDERVRPDSASTIHSRIYVLQNDA